MLRMLLPLDSQVRPSSRHSVDTVAHLDATSPRVSLTHPIGNNNGYWKKVVKERRFFFFFQSLLVSHSYKPHGSGLGTRGFFFYFFLPPARFWKRREVLFWGPSPSPPSPPSPPSQPMFCLISRLLLKLAFWNLACAIYAKTILLKCF